ncbi:MAG: hypothetical protein V4696_01130 [Pseudomonadota bacterium]
MSNPLLAGLAARFRLRERPRDAGERVAPMQPTGGMLKVRARRSIWPVVSMPKFFAILIAVAMLFAPFAMPSGSAMAATTSGHGQMMSEGHCETQPALDMDIDAAGGSCCVAMCAAAAIPAPQFVAERVFAPLPAIALATSQYRSVLGEIATPPPRWS